MAQTSAQVILAGFHAVGARLRADPASIEVLYYDAQRRDGRMQQLLARAAAAQVRCLPADGARLQGLSPQAPHQGVVAQAAAPRPTAGLEELLDAAGPQTFLLLLDGVTDPTAWAEAIDGETSAAIFAQPNFYGAVEDAAALSEAAATASGHENGAGPVVIAQVDPLTLGVLRPPGECGVDVAVGEGQSLGNRLDFGGPSFGLFAAREAYLRRMPGRIAGETKDVDGRRGFVLTLQTREQHIRREKATSNICTAQALNALGGVVYLSWLGRRGIVELGELLLARTHYARERLAALPGVEKLHEQPVVREFPLRLDADVSAVRRRCAENGINPGADLHALTGRPEDRGGLLVAITERRSRADIDRLAEVLGAAVAASEKTPATALTV